MFVDSPAARRVWQREYYRILFVPSLGIEKPCHQYVEQIAYAWGYSHGAPKWFIEEALQQAWTASWFQFHQFDPFKSAFSTWVLAIYRNELASLFHERSRYFRVLTEADFPNRAIVDLSDDYVAHHDVEERQPDDTSVLGGLDVDVKGAALKVLQETGDLARGWQTKVAEEIGVSRMTITHRLSAFREVATWGSVRESGES